jgi:hypothetical protein
MEETRREERIELILRRVEDAISSSSRLRSRASLAAECLVDKYRSESDESLATTLRNLLPKLLEDKVTAFFSYKERDKIVAERIVDRLETWSNNNLFIYHMGRLPDGEDWRKWIENALKECDWFLMLLPSPQDGVDGENVKDWLTFEAGYYFREKGLCGRLVGLHHPGTNLPEPLKNLQFVPATEDKVEKFLTNLLVLPNWIPGKPALNAQVKDLASKAKEIVDLIQPPTGRGKKFCCGAHMEVAFDDASAVKGLEQLAAGRVRDSNYECRRLFGLDIPKTSFGEWVSVLMGDENNRKWLEELASAVRTVGEGNEVPPINASFCVRGRMVHSSICAVTRREQCVESVDILFNDAGLPPATNTMNPDLAALALTLEYGVRFRYQVLEQFAHRKLDSKDVVKFLMHKNRLFTEAAKDPRFFATFPDMRNMVLGMFVGEDRDDIKEMYERYDQLQLLDDADALDNEALGEQVKEMLGMNQRFVELTAKRFVELFVVSTDPSQQQASHGGGPLPPTYSSATFVDEERNGYIPKSIKFAKRDIVKSS